MTKSCTNKKRIQQRHLLTVLKKMCAALFRYGPATIGPLSVSIVHFLATLLMLQELGLSEFGLFALILVAVQFGFGLSNALIGTPFMVRVNRGDGQEALFFKTNLLLSLAVGLVCALGAIMMRAQDVAQATGAFSALAVMRWFWRSYFYALHKPMRAAFSDLVYALTLALALSGLWLTEVTMSASLWAFALAAAVALVACGPTVFAVQGRAILMGRLINYAGIWREQSRWTLLGVVSTEATANAHAWLVTLVAGPAAFAPLAAAALFFRPVGLCITSLTQLERPPMARALAAGEPLLAQGIARRFRKAMILVWGGTVLMALGILWWWPSLVIKEGYDLSTILWAVGFWAMINLLNSWRAPDSAFLQAANALQPLATASVWSGIATVASVVVLMSFFDPLASMLGVLLGQIILAWRIALLTRSWRYHG
jgi:hypothetical protein